MLVKEVVLWFVAEAIIQCYGQFTIPDVTLEAYEPKGFRASIPATEGIQLFAFHGNVNKQISQVDPGDYSQDFTSPTDKNIWSYYNPDLTLKVGDEVYFWIFIQHDKLGYRKDNQKWKVTELVKLGNKTCEESITTVNGKTLICKGDVIFEENFNGPQIDRKKWSVEQYIPTYNSLDYEFNSYQNRPEVCYVSDNKLFIKPKIANNDNEISGELDLRGSCTRNTEDECYFKREIYLIVPPVTSGRLVSTPKFKFGKVEIRAKLPAGDWIYPQIYLEHVRDPQKKLWIAYARGNAKLLASSQEDIGASLLFGGPVLSAEEPDRSQYLNTTTNKNLFTSQIHTYTLLWTKDQIAVEVDGKQYGSLDKQTVKEMGFAESEMVQIVLGVGIGGVNDFPDDFRSGNNVKPWRNKDNKQVKNFFDARNSWEKTWRLTTDNRALQVDSVKVWAV